MLKSYCPSCGAENLYTLQKPKFCNVCGKGMSIVMANSPKIVPKITPIIKNELAEPELEPEIETSPEMFKVDVLGDGEVNIARKVKFENLIKEQKTGFSRPKSTLTKEQVMEELKQTGQRAKYIDAPESE